MQSLRLLRTLYPTQTPSPKSLVILLQPEDEPLGLIDHLSWAMVQRRQLGKGVYDLRDMPLLRVND